MGRDTDMKNLSTDMNRIGIKLRANYNGLLTMLNNEGIKTDQSTELLEELLGGLENTIIDSGFKYEVQRDRDGNVRRISEISYDPKSTKSNTRTFSLRTPTSKSMDNSDRVSKKDPEGNLIYIGFDDFNQFKDESLNGDIYVGVAEDFTNNRYLDDFQEDSFVAMVIQETDTHVIVKAKSSFKNYRGLECYILIKDDTLDDNRYAQIEDIKFDDYSHLGRMRYLSNIKTNDSVNFYKITTEIRCD